MSVEELEIDEYACLGSDARSPGQVGELDGSDFCVSTAGLYTDPLQKSIEITELMSEKDNNNNNAFLSRDIANCVSKKLDNLGESNGKNVCNDNENGSENVDEHDGENNGENDENNDDENNGENNCNNDEENYEYTEEILFMELSDV
ncbi:putative uncharacterized protein DDB_G0283431 [Solenopsis invicta]|uniref:putative uncharacterized protein DDB_G0283431 n=1 Tax=Solenopsis invicta TaxID=13686 RepID=UPI000595C945|nr:putative uncharacterized protein DDB_G0283431 [Solenopsis invicta]